MRGVFLFSLQSANVASVLYGLEQEDILASLAGGSTADRLQALIEMLRVVNAAWRVNNPWGGLNSPLLATPFALEEDGGIGIEDIRKDAVTLRSTLLTLEEARMAGRARLSAAMAGGLQAAFRNGLEEILKALVGKRVLRQAVKINTTMYGTAPEDCTMKTVLARLKRR